MARQGPIARYTAIVRIRANFGWTEEARFISPPACAAAMTPAIGSATALTESPRKASQKLVPACMPR